MLTVGFAMPILKLLLRTDLNIHALNVDSLMDLKRQVMCHIYIFMYHVCILCLDYKRGSSDKCIDFTMMCVFFCLSSPIGYRHSKNT